MKLSYSLVTFNGMGGHPMLSFVGDFLLVDAPPIRGAAFDAIDIYANLQHSGPRSPNLHLLASRFDTRWKTLPQVWLRRKRRLIEIAYAAGIGSAEDIFEVRADVPPTVFAAACREVFSLLAVLAPRLCNQDLDIATLEQHFARRLLELPAIPAALQEALAVLQSTGRTPLH